MSESEKSTLKALFEKYEEKQTALEEAKAAVEKATNERSYILQDILDLSGPGPYNRNGQVLKIVRRGNTLFFRGRGEKETIDV